MTHLYCRKISNHITGLCDNPARGPGEPFRRFELGFLRFRATPRAYGAPAFRVRMTCSRGRSAVQPRMKTLAISLVLLAASVTACSSGDVFVDEPQGSFTQGVDGPDSPPLLPRDGFAVRAADGYVSLVFSDADVDTCHDGYVAPGTTRVAFLLPPRAITSPGPHAVDVTLDTVDVSCSNLRPISDMPAYGEVTIDAVEGGSVRGSYKYTYRGSDVYGSFDVAFCDVHPSDDDLACRW